MQYTLADTSVIWDMLLSNPNLPNEGNAKYREELIDISVNLNILGIKNKSFAFNSDGYIQTNILESGKTFFIGKDKVNMFIEYVTQNAVGKIIERIPIENEDIGNNVITPPNTPQGELAFD
jgi:hypothetical protein